MNGMKRFDEAVGMIEYVRCIGTLRSREISLFPALKFPRRGLYLAPGQTGELYLPWDLA